jgi:hypothetical protein
MADGEKTERKAMKSKSALEPQRNESVFYDYSLNRTTRFYRAEAFP